jgi:cold shock protein
MASLNLRYQGIVREYDRYRGCGTIELETGERAFVRYSAIRGEGLRSLNCGDHVAFEIEQNHRGLNAVNVTLLQQ